MQTKMFKLVVLCSVLALAAAKPGFVTPLTYSVFPIDSSVSQYSTSVVHGSPLYTAGVYSAPYVTQTVVPDIAALSQAPNSPAVVLDAVNGVPLDTPEVVAARIAHYQAKALAGVHHLKKRSLAPLSYSAFISPLTHSGLSPVSPLTYSSPLVSAYSRPALLPTPLTYSSVSPHAYGVYAWKK